MEDTIKNLKYKDSGVNIDAGNDLVDKIKPDLKKTHRPGANVDIGGFGGLFDLKAAGFKDPILVSGTDGVGTKLKVAIETGRHDTVGIDLVAMCVNDLIVQGAEPLFFLDYYACSALEVDDAADVIKGIAEGCAISGCALIGGETAEMPGMYTKGDYDLAGFCVGAVEREGVITGQSITEGDVVLGLGSSGLHSNGYSLVRRVVELSGLTYGDQSPFSENILADELLIPTKIYVKSLLQAIRCGGVKGLSHITGGGFTENIPRVMPDNLAVTIDLSAWDMPPVFQWLSEAGNIETSEMLRTFNCGVGMVAIVAADKADEIQSTLTQNGETVFVLGSVVKKTDEAVIYENVKE